jgi:hypothetical protein
MEAQKPKSIQTVGTLITAISALMMFIIDEWFNFIGIV